MVSRSFESTNPSVRGLAGDSDPLEAVTGLARQTVLNAIQDGWQGPPFDPLWLAAYLGIPTAPREDIQDARTVPIGVRGVRIEYNPNRPRARMRFSVAHEISHTLFPDCAEAIRNRTRVPAPTGDAWQLELMCNVAAAEFIMPIGTAAALENEPVTIENILRLQKEFDVSTEAVSIRLAKITSEPCLVFAAARTADDQASFSFRVDYSITSRSSRHQIPRGFNIPSKSVLAECTAVGFTAKGIEQWPDGLPKMELECVGVPPYPGHYFPRVIGLARGREKTPWEPPRVRLVRGDATSPRGPGKRIIAHIVNDKTPKWGRGFGFGIRRKFPEAQESFIEWAGSRPGNLTLGNTFVSRVGRDLLIVHMVAQHGYGPSPKPRIRYAVLRDCLERLAEIASSEKATVHMPRIGTGEAGGRWDVVSEIIDEILVRRGVDVTVYELPSAGAGENPQGRLNLSF